MGDVEIDYCSVCEKKTQVLRKYYYYDIKCNCHSPKHFEIVRHCVKCIPKPPERTTINIEPESN